MNTNFYFEVAARYEKRDDTGRIKLVTELFLVPACSFTEAEARITKALNCPLRVVKEKISNISEVVTATDDDAEKFYKVKHDLVTLDEHSGKEKKSPQYLLFQASSNDDARRRYEAYMKGSVTDTELEAIAETKFVEYITDYNDNDK